MKAKLTLRVTYEGADANEANIRHLLQSLVEFAEGRGHLTDEFNLTVVESDFDIEVKADDTVRGVWARFQPQAWINNEATDIDGARNFDVTMTIEQMGREKALELKDNSREATELWHTFTMLRGREGHHDGPFRIEVADAIHKFYGLDD
jgi:hypothetical protein